MSQSGQNDVYQYDNLPTEFRVQVAHIWKDAIGTSYESLKLWQVIHNMICREKGVFTLAERHNGTDFDRCQHHLLTADTDDTLDIIELAFRVCDRIARKEHGLGIILGPDGALAELNDRFREHGIGYQYEQGELIRVDSQYIHAEAVVPALRLLQDVKFSGPSDEFLSAHEHYRKGEHKEAIVDALKAFESTMKAICDARGWKYDATATAKTLINMLFDNGLIPKYMENHFAGLRTTLEAGLPTVRNKTSGHGQGAQPVVVPGYLAAYALHLAASNIGLLVEAHKALP